MSATFNFAQVQPLFLKYFSESGAKLTRSYGFPVGLDCPTKTMTIVYDDDSTVEIDCTNGAQTARDSLLTVYYNRRDAGKSTTIIKVICDTGIHIEPMGARFWVMACANSRIVKTDLVLQNGVGIIDPDYRGPIKFFYANLRPSEDIAFMNSLSTTCGQLVPVNYHTSGMSDQEVASLEELSTTSRDQGGFGSSAGEETTMSDEEVMGDGEVMSTAPEEESTAEADEEALTPPTEEESEPIKEEDGTVTAENHVEEKEEEIS